MNTCQPSSQKLPNRRTMVEDALTYLDEIKYTFAEKPEVYGEFLDLMKDFKLSRCDVPKVIDSVSKLFKDHPKLIVGFSIFLPPGYEIEVESDDFDGGYVLVCESSFSDSTSSAFSTSTASSSDVSNNTSSPPIGTSYVSTIGSVLTSVTSVWGMLPSIMSSNSHNQ